MPYVDDVIIFCETALDLSKSTWAEPWRFDFGFGPTKSAITIGSNFLDQVSAPG